MVQTHVKFPLGCPATNCKIWAMQLRIFRRVTPSLLRHSLYTRYRYHFNNLAPAPATGGIKPLSPHQPCWHGLDKEMLDACAPPKRQPEELRKLIEEAKVSPAKKREMSPRRKPDEMGRWLCNQCGQMFFQDAFSCRTGRKFPPSMCRKCETKESLLYRRTLRGNLKHTPSQCLEKGQNERDGIQPVLPAACWHVRIPRWTLCVFWIGKWKLSDPTVTGECLSRELTIAWGTHLKIAVLVAGEFNSADYSLGEKCGSW